ncbi:MAG: hypothetical protein M1822_003672 [Bathelium mastoideum]|nr:MAG: hypothetical protein M1822_003672 [Bathelium mastoideum]
MGFINSCWDAFLLLSSYNPLNGFDRNQRPLDLPQALPEGHLAAGATFRPANSSITCQYPAGWTYCGSANNRECWLQNTGKVSGPKTYNISTDYENSWPTGVLREYWLDTSELAIAPDGYLKTTGLVFNNTYPGPILEACWGDTIRVHVTNSIGREGTTIHWHGIRQLNTTEMDGVNGVTQCPIAQNDTFTYQFLAQQYGHTWYHSHYQTQYSDGLMGGLVIYGPSSANYDEAFLPALINDWVHDNSTDVLNQELHGGAPTANSLVFNGTGTFRCSDLDPKCCSNKPGDNLPPRDPRCPSPAPNGPLQKVFVKGKRYLLRLVNSSAAAMFIFSIDEHELEVIATDLVPIHPYKTASLFIGIGQRYQVVVTATPKNPSADGNYWMRTRVATGCGSVEQDDEETGIIRYNNASTALPTTVPNDGRIACEDEPVKSLVPVVQWNVTRDTLDNAQNENELNSFTFQADVSSVPFHNFNRWELTNTPLYLNYSNPSLLNISGTLRDPNYAAIDYDFKNNYVVLVVDGAALQNITKLNTPAAHPIHMHGHDFVILDQNDDGFDVKNALKRFNFKNPPRRDVALLPSGGYLAMAFQPDNPGIWLVHCHIAWHASSGLALQIFERTEKIPSVLAPGALKETERVCTNWDKWHLEFNQTDSGI